MVTQLPKNEFISNSGAHVPIAPGSAADSPLPPLKSAAAFLVSDAEVLPRASEPEAAVVNGSPTTAAASDISDIPEIFRVANLLCEVDRFTPDEEAIYSAALDEFAARAFDCDEVWADLSPLFLQNVKA